MQTDNNSLSLKNDNYIDSVHRRIRKLLEEKENKRITDDYIAKIIDADQSRVNKVYNSKGKSRFNIEQYIALAKYLNISLDEMFDLTADNITPQKEQLSPRKLCEQLAALSISDNPIEFSQIKHNEHCKISQYMAAQAENEYDSIFFPEYISDESDNHLSVNYSEVNQCINKFLSRLQQFRNLLNKGDLDKETFDFIMEKCLSAVPDNYSAPINLYPTFAQPHLPYSK